MKAKDLKNSILQMAVQGKLVPQDPNDEPASVLLERIREERKKLIAEGKMKASKGGESVIFRGSDGKYYEKRVDAKGREPEPVCIDGEVPFEIPESWEWARVSTVFEVSNGFTPAKTNAEYWSNGDISWFSAADIKEQGCFIESTIQAITEIALGNRMLTPSNTVLLCCTASVGDVAFTKIPLVTNQQYNSLIQLDIDHARLNPLYVYYWALTLKSSLLAVAGTTTFPFVSVGKLEKFLIPIPSLEEQSRIVKKLERAETCIAQYAALETERKQLDAELPKRLHKSILQMAVQGKLVAQDPSDEPASVLLERIREERRKLIADGKMKAPKGGESVIYRGSDGGYYEKRIDVKGNESKPVCLDDEIPFKIPGSWEWCRLGSLASLVTKGTTPRGGSATYVSEGVGFLRAENVCEDGTVSTENLKYIPIKTHQEFTRSQLAPLDLLITIAGTLGRSAVVHEKQLPLNTNQAIAIVRVIEKELLKFILIALKSPEIYSLLTSQKKVTAIPNLTLEQIADLLIPIPPVAEQGRIEEKLENITL